MCNNPKATLVVSKDRTPEIWEHIREAIQDRGQPSCLTYWPLYDVDNDSAEFIQATQQAVHPNRASALIHFQIEDGGKGFKYGYSRDEYPFACTLEGGTDSSVKYVPNTEQSVQGGQLSTFLRYNYMGRGDKFHVVGDPPFE